MPKSAILEVQGVSGSNGSATAPATTLRVSLRNQNAKKQRRADAGEVTIKPKSKVSREEAEISNSGLAMLLSCCSILVTASWLKAPKAVLFLAIFYSRITSAVTKLNF